MLLLLLLLLLLVEQTLLATPPLATPKLVNGEPTTEAGIEPATMP